MNTEKLKAAIFDAEQALTWTRQAIEEGDTAATIEALTMARIKCTAGIAEIQPVGAPGS